MKEKIQNTFYGSATVGTKGQVVIPIKIRKEINIEAGDTLIFMSEPKKGYFWVMKPDCILAWQRELEKVQQQVSKKG